MALSIFSLNIERGRHMDREIKFFENNYFDFVLLQEVVGGKFNLERDSLNNNLLEISEVLGHNYIFAPQVILKNDPNSFIGTAIFYNPKYKLIHNNLFYTESLQFAANINLDWSSSPRCAQIGIFETSEGIISLVNLHLAWSKTTPDTPERLRQAKLITDYLEKQKLDNLIIAGDFNAEQSSKMMEWFRTLGRDMTSEYKITNTINKSFHRNSKSIGNLNLAVDHMFINKRINVRSYRLVDNPDLSDHYGLNTIIDLP